MRKIISTSVILLMLISCGSYQSFNLKKLTTGMTKADVIAVVGEPERMLAMNQTDKGFQEVLEYRTSRDEAYALEFWNDYLTGYEFLYDDIQYIPSLYPPTIWPDYGRPIYMGPGNRPVRPNRPNRPSQPNRPNRPEPERPPVNRPQTKPTPGVGPSARPTTRPSVNTNTNSNQTPDRSTLRR